MLAAVATSGAGEWILTSCEDEGGESERVEDIAHVYRLEVRTIMRDGNDSSATCASRMRRSSACERGCFDQR